MVIIDATTVVDFKMSPYMVQIYSTYDKISNLPMTSPMNILATGSVKLPAEYPFENYQCPRLTDERSTHLTCTQHKSKLIR